MDTMLTRVTKKNNANKAAEKVTKGHSEASEAGDSRDQRQETPSAEKTLLGGLDAIRGFIETTSQVVQQATKILEEEIGAGILTAKQIEDSLINVKALRAANAESVIHRFRKDAHEAMDILVDVVGSAVNYAEKMSKRAVSFSISGSAEKATRQKTARQESGLAPYLKVPGVLKSGQSIQVPMTLENGSDALTEKLRFFSTDLISSAGGRIPARQLSFKPPILTIKPHGSGTILVRLKIPSGTKPGLYSGLVQSSQMDQLCAVLAVQVG